MPWNDLYEIESENNMRNFIVIHPNNHTKALVVHAPLRRVYSEEEQQQQDANAIHRGCARSCSALSRIPEMREIMFCW